MVQKQIPRWPCFCTLFFNAVFKPQKMNSTLLKSTLWACSLVLLQGTAQTYSSQSSTVHFFSATAVENIEATSKESSSAINSKTGDVMIIIPVISFKFDSHLMEEHFNENYMETEKYPKATFKGKITNLAEVDFTKDGEYTLEVEGDLTVHGVTKPRKITGKLVVKGETLTASAKFDIVLEEHKVERPKLVWEKIAEKVAVDVNFVYKPYVKK